jgi:hypothetical protein
LWLLRNTFVIQLTNRHVGDADLSVGRIYSYMLLPSILRILDQNDPQWNVAEPKPRIHAHQPEGSSGLQKIEVEIAAAADLLKAPDATAQPATRSTGPFMEELLRAITKFEQPEEPRVVDVFE